MAVLAQFGDHDARTTAGFGSEFLDVSLDRFPRFDAFHNASVNTRDGLVIGAETAEDLLEGIRDFTHRCAQAHGVDGELEQIAFAGFGALRQRGERSIDGRRVARRTNALDAGNLRFAYRHVVDVEDVDFGFLGQLVLVDANDDLLARIDLCLRFGRALLDFHLGPAGFDSLGHAAHLVDFFDDGPSLVGHFLGQLFHHVGTAPRIDHVADMGFFLDDDLRVAGDARREIGRQRDGFVKRIGVQRLRAAEDRRHGFDGGANHVVVRILLGQRPARGLAVRTQHLRFRALGVETGHDTVPQQAAGTHLGDFEVEVHAHRPEEGQAASEVVDVKARLDTGTYVLFTVGQRKGQFDGLVGAGFGDVITRDGDRVELRHVRRGVLEDVRDDLHRRLGRVDVGVTDHELLENVVLDGPGELILLHTLLFGRNDVTSKDRQHRAVHGHRNGNLVERNTVEENLHVFDRVDRHAGLADVADDARIIGVIATVRGQVESDRDPLTAGGQRLAIEGIGFFGGRETGILTNRPGTTGVHGGLRAADVRSKTGQRVGIGQIRRIGLGIQRLDGDAFGRDPFDIGDVAAGRSLRCRFFPHVQIGRVGECWCVLGGHDFTFQDEKLGAFLNRK